MSAAQAMVKPSGIVPPRQKRSAQALERLVDASIAMISEGSFDDARITQIIDRAGYSVGAFYGRFDSKEALFHLVQERVIDEAKSWAGREINRFRNNMSGGDKGASQAQTIAFIVDLLVRFYERKAGVLRAMFLHTRIRNDELLFRRVREFNSWALEQTVQLYSEASGETNEAQFTAGFEIIASYLREKMLFGDPVPTIKARQKVDIETIARFFQLGVGLRGADLAETSGAAKQ